MQIFEKNAKYESYSYGAVKFRIYEQMLQIPWVKSEKGIRKVCFMNDLLFHENFGANVHVNFVSNNRMIK